MLSELNIDTAREYVIHERERELSPYTVQSKVRALKAFASWLSNEDYTTDHVLHSLKMPKAPQNLIEPLSAAEIDQLVKNQNPLTALGCRNTAILVLLLDTGLKVSLLCHGFLGKRKVCPESTKRRAMILEYKARLFEARWLRRHPELAGPASVTLANLRQRF